MPSGSGGHLHTFASFQYVERFYIDGFYKPERNLALSTTVKADRKHVFGGIRFAKILEAYLRSV